MLATPLRLDNIPGASHTLQLNTHSPYTITMVPVIELLAAAGLGLPLQTLAWALAFGACFGG